MYDVTDDIIKHSCFAENLQLLFGMLLHIFDIIGYVQQLSKSHHRLHLKKSRIFKNLAFRHTSLIIIV